jgi:hypothetical protein
MMYNITSISGIGGLGDDVPVAPPTPHDATSEIFDSPVYQVLSFVGMAAGAYHGYKRNNSIGWAIAWGLLGGIAPVITLPVSLAQGFGKPKH